MESSLMTNELNSVLMPATEGKRSKEAQKSRPKRILDRAGDEWTVNEKQIPKDFSRQQMLGRRRLV
jgi:hypothetical protein